MSYDPFYAPIRMPDGTEVFGSAAFTHRVKLLGGPTGLVNHVLTSLVQHADEIADAQQVASKRKSNVVRFPRKKVA
ncbi:hypothetical protein [Azospirillum argentinense]